jgi:two-component system OmpR family response regulator/two-component system alkaline phosphatase synthesis response regulator PhoP
MSRKHVLVVEDEPHIRDLVCLHLGLEGYECVPIGDGREALKMLTDRSFDLVVLDIMLPGVDGVTICRAVRRQGVNRDVPILVLTARREESDKVLGLDSGADDYLTKPFGMRELVARVGALTRRARSPLADEMDGLEPSLSIHGLEIDPARRALTVRGERVEVTRQEFHLLHLLASNPGIVFTRDRLLSKVWQGQAFVTGRSVDTLVKRLRRKV